MKTIGVTDPRLNGGKPTVIPSVWNGRTMSQKASIELAVRSGETWPAFDTFQQADAADKKWHQYMSYMGGRAYQGYARGGVVLDANASVANNTGYYVPDTQQPQQQQQGGGIPSYSAVSKFLPSSAAAAPAADSGGVGITDASSGMFTDLGGGAASSGGSSAGSLAANPYAWLAAAIIATGSSLQHNNVSSVPHQLEGDMPNDVIHSQNVQNWLKGTFGDNGAKDISDTLRPYTDLHGVRNLSKLPEDSWKSATAPWRALARHFN